MFKPMYDSTREGGFQIKRVFGDKAYATRSNLKLVVGNYAEPYIRFRDNAKFSDTDSVWNHLLHFYSANRNAFYQHYHLRSNVEAVFSSAKRKFGRKLLSKTEEAQTVEVMAKVLAYNITVVIRSLFELGIEPDFRKPTLEAGI
jgi:transposase